MRFLSHSVRYGMHMYATDAEYVDNIWASTYEYNDISSRPGGLNVCLSLHLLKSNMVITF